jgi:hypothetical protein
MSPTSYQLLHPAIHSISGTFSLNCDAKIHILFPLATIRQKKSLKKCQQAHTKLFPTVKNPDRTASAKVGILAAEKSLLLKKSPHEHIRNHSRIHFH